VGDVEVTWSGLGPFDVATGDLEAVLRGGSINGGDFASAAPLLCGTKALSTTHRAPNVPGRVTYYLVRESSGTVGWNDTHQVGDRNRSLTACPP
jgi:hypothetical protein